MRWALRALLAVAWVLMIAAPWADPKLPLNDQLVLTALIIAIPVLLFQFGWFLRRLERDR